MFEAVFSRLRPLLIGVFLVGVASPGITRAASLAHFAGTGTGLLLISQGTGVVVGNANPKVTATARKATFVLKCTINNVAANQTISLANGRATINHLLPGLSGFTSSARGTYKTVGSKVRATLPFSYPNTSTGSTTTGTLYLEIDTTTFGSTLRISSQMVFTDGTLPINMTVIAT